MKEMAAGHHASITNKEIPNDNGLCLLKKTQFFHIPVTAENVLRFIITYPGCTVTAIQDEMHYHRGNRRYLRIRRAIHEVVLLLDVSGLIVKEGVRYYPTPRGRERVQP